MALIVTDDLIELTKIGLNEVFMNELDAPGQLHETIFQVENSEKSIEEFLEMAGFGNVPGWDADGGKLNYDKPLSGKRIGMTHNDYGFAWKVSHKILREDLYHKTSKDLVTAAALSVRHSTEMDAANVFNLGFDATAGLGKMSQLRAADGTYGAALFADHLMLDGANHFDNRIGKGTNMALTEEALQAAVTQIRRAKNHRGQPVVYGLDCLVVPPELELVAKKILGAEMSAVPAKGSNGSDATLKTDITNSSGIYRNVLNGMIPNTYVWAYLVSPTAWFIGATKTQRKLLFYWREKPVYDAQKDFDTKGVANSVNYAYSCGPVMADGWWGNAGV